MKYTSRIHQKHLGPIEFLSNEKLIERFFYVLETREKKINLKDVNHLQLLKIQEVLTSLNLTHNLISKIRNGDGKRYFNNNDHQKFIERYDQTIGRLIKERERKFMEGFLTLFKKNQYNITKTLRELNSSQRILKSLEKKYKFHSKVKSLIKEFEIQNREVVYKGRMELCLELYKKGIRVRYSRKISGVDEPNLSKLKNTSPKLYELIKSKVQKKDQYSKFGNNRITQQDIDSCLLQIQKLMSLNDLKLTPIQTNHLNDCILSENKLLVEFNKKFNNSQTLELEKLRGLEKKNKYDGIYLKKSYVRELIEGNDKSFIREILNHLKLNFSTNKDTSFSPSKTFKNFNYDNKKVKPFHITEQLKFNSEVKKKFLKLIDEIKLSNHLRSKDKFLEYYRSGRGFRKYIREKDIIKELGISYLTLKVLNETFKRELKEIKSKYFSESWDEWILKSKDRVLDFQERGFHYNDSLMMGGMGDGGSKRLESILEIVKDREFEKKFIKGVRRFNDKKEWLPISDQKIRKKRDYIEKLTQLKLKNEEIHSEKFKGMEDKDFNRKYQVGYDSLFHSKNYLPPEYPFYLRRVLIVLIRQREKELIKDLKKFERRKKVVDFKLKNVPRNDRERVSKVSRSGKIFYDVNQNVIYRTCSSCIETKPINHFPRRKNGRSSKCLECLNIMRYGTKNKKYKGDWKGGVQIKKRNSNNEITHLRCTSCNQFKINSKFRYRFQGSRVCEDCYVILPNNVLTRRGEFKTINGKQVRVRLYDEKTFSVLKKRCSKCEKLLPIDLFGLNNSSPYDGRSYRCKPCLNKKSLKK